VRARSGGFHEHGSENPTTRVSSSSLTDPTTVHVVFVHFSCARRTLVSILCSAAERQWRFGRLGWNLEATGRMLASSREGGGTRIGMTIVLVCWTCVLFRACLVLFLSILYSCTPRIIYQMSLTSPNSTPEKKSEVHPNSSNLIEQ
jgi:hypothetical protein